MRFNPIYENLIAIINSAIKNQKLKSEVISKLSEDEIKKVYKLLTFHNLGHILYGAVKFNQIDISSAFNKELENSYIKASINDENIAFQHKNVILALEKAKINHITLKGETLKSYYPKNFIRPSCDIDILVEPKNLKKATKIIKEQTGVKKVERNYHDITITTNSGVLIELHFSLKENNEKLDKITAEPFKNAYLVDGKEYEYKLNDEFLFAYLLSHLAYHLTSGGLGIKAFIDLYLFKNAVCLNEEKLIKIIKKGELQEFYNKINEFISVWFGDKQHNEFTRLFEEFVILGGVYGTAEQKNAVLSVKSNGKENRLLRKVFLPYNTLKEYYPILEKLAILYPIFIVVRLVKVLFNKDRAKRAKKEINSSITNDKKQNIERLFQELNI